MNHSSKVLWQEVVSTKHAQSMLGNCNHLFGILVRVTIAHQEMLKGRRKIGFCKAFDQYTWDAYLVRFLPGSHVGEWTTVGENNYGRITCEYDSTCSLMIKKAGRKRYVVGDLYWYETNVRM